MLKLNQKPTDKQLAEVNKLMKFSKFMGEDAENLATEMGMPKSQIQVLRSMQENPWQRAIDAVIAEPIFEKAIMLANNIHSDCKTAEPAAQALLDKCFNNAYYFQQTYEFAKDRFGCKEIANQAMKSWDAMWMKGIPNLRAAEQAKELAGYCRKGSDPRRLALRSAKFLLEIEEAEQN